MIAYLDTNVYISAEYKFSSGKFATLSSLIADRNLKVIYSSATQGEVEQHIIEDISTAVTKYNRLLHKELSPIIGTADFKLNKLTKKMLLLQSKALLLSFFHWME